MMVSHGLQLKISKKVLKAGYECVHFDRDAEIVDGLLAWDW